MKYLPILLTLLPGPSSAAVIWGAQCGYTSSYTCIGTSSNAALNAISSINGKLTDNPFTAQGFNGSGIRIRINIEHPITDVASGKTCVSQTDLNPAAANNTIKLANYCASNFSSGGFATSDFWGGATVQYTKNGYTLTITSDGLTPVYPTYFIPATINYKILGAGNVVAAAQAAGLFIDYTFLNAASSNDASDDLIRDQNGLPCQTTACNADFRANLLYTWNDILATAPGGKTTGVWTIGNEETGGNIVNITSNGFTSIANGGSGYSVATTVSLTNNGSGSGFIGIVNVSGGSVTSINVADGGSNYITPPTVIFSPNTCTATAVSNINPLSGSITYIKITNGGSNCSQGSQLTLNNGAVINITSVDGNGAIVATANDAGWAYGNYPTIPIYGIGKVVPVSTTGGGTGATFTFDLNNNGDYSGNETPGTYNVAEYQQKLTNAVIVGHSVGVKVGDSGVQGLPLYLSYWNDQYFGPKGPTSPAYLGSCGSHTCQENMDGLVQTYFSKNVNQIDFGGNLPNNCNIGTGAYSAPSYGLPAGKILLIQKFHALINAEIAAGLDFQNFHYYQIVPYSTMVALNWLKSINGGLPLAMDEVGEYGNSYADALNIAALCEALNTIECIWWNRNSGNTQRAITMQYPGTYQPSSIQNTLNQNGQAWADIISGTAVSAGIQPAPVELPLC